MEYLTKWFDNLASNKGGTWPRATTARGECRRHTGPGLWYAAVDLTFIPSDKFEIEDKSTPQVRDHKDGLRWYEQIVFGVLDVMLTRPTMPIWNFRLIISNIDYDEIESNPMAFRLAARDAALKILGSHYPSDAKP